MKVPAPILRQLYDFGSLQVSGESVRFSLKNRLSDATVTRLHRVKIGNADLPLDTISLMLPNGQVRKATEVSPANSLPFPVQQRIEVRASGHRVPEGKHEISLAFETAPFGELDFVVQDAAKKLAARKKTARKLPCNKADNYTPDIVRERQQFVKEFSGVDFRHIGAFSFDAAATQGNIENFTGVAQVPLAFVGPVRVNGEAARGEFLVPMATTEGTMVASYNRGIKVLNLSGGVNTVVIGDGMQRAPVFVFDSARDACAFKQWVDEHFDPIRQAAEATSRIARLLHVETFLVSKFAYLRFNYSTGDAAGQNMVGKATFAACNWILEQVNTVRRFFLEANMATDKKSSAINTLSPRGKRVTAEAVIPRDVLVENLRVEPETLCYHGGLSMVGTMMSGANNNGAQSPNGLAAVFIATGQDVANLAESSAGTVYAEVMSGGDLYVSITIPSLIVATHGGGTGLPTQRECLEIMDCYGAGKVRKFAEILAAVSLAGDLSLGAAICASDWVSSHEKLGRNR
ncbi:MAG: hydroxymethylglutaryl-CoA reductase [Bacteroidales bacterium]